MKIKTFSIIIFFIMLIFFNISYAGNIIIDQNTTVKNDGSGTIKLLYSSKNTDVENFMIGNYPFGPKVQQIYFSSPYTEVKNTGFYKSVNDTSIYNGDVTIDFKDLNKLSGVKGFGDQSASWTSTDSGAFFKWTIKPNSKASAQITQYTYRVTFEDEVISSNGQDVKDKSVTWYRDGKNIDPNKEIVLTALIKSNSSTGGKKGDGKSCGLFGFELPVILLGGLVFLQRNRKARTKK